MSDAPGGGGYLPVPLHQVRPVHAGGGHPNQHLAGAGAGIGR